MRTPYFDLHKRFSSGFSTFGLNFDFWPDFHFRFRTFRFRPYFRLISPTGIVWLLGIILCNKLGNGITVIEIPMEFAGIYGNLCT